ncbi:MAG: c-type cytochrome [Acidobacteria bacterium]|nr:c-type cytochrome [Acidobacteriota bacterium]
MKPIPAIFFAAASTCWAQTPATNPYLKDPKAAEGGRAAFRVYCSPCHGIRGEGGRGPDLTLGTYASGERDSDLFRTITEGVPGTEMPSYSNMPDEAKWHLVSFLRSIARRDAGGVKGNVRSGEQLFWAKGGCGACHAVGARGGRLGPELTRVGRQRSLAYLRESVLAPGEDVTPGYQTVTVVTREGRKITGVERAFDNFSAQLMDSKENLHSFARSRVRSVEREYRSLMPDTYGKLFSGAELEDLVAYLASLRGQAHLPLSP